MKKDLVYLYTDASPASERVRQALEKRRIEYVTVPRNGSRRKVPAIASDKYVFEGVDEIRRYLLPELAR